MSVKYNVVERGNPGDPLEPKKYYPSIVASGRVSLRDLSEQISFGTTLSSADVSAVLEALLAIIPMELKRGNVVELGDFGSIWLRTRSTGAETPGEVKAGQFRSVLPRFNSGKEFRKVLLGVDFEKKPEENGSIAPTPIG